MNEKIKKLLPYLSVLLSFFIIVVLTIVFADAYLFPSLVQTKNTVTIPDFSGKQLSEVQTKIKELELKVNEVVEQFSQNTPEGIVINQNPKPGQIVKIGRRIYLTVSKGEKDILMPGLISKTVRSARVDLMNVGLEMGEVSFEFHETIGLDTIFKQSFPKGRKTNSGTTVDVVVSKGPENQVLVPNLAGEDFDNLETILIESGLVLGKVIKEDGGGTFLPNTVISQYPTAGTLVPGNTVVNIVITQ